MRLLRYRQSNLALTALKNRQEVVRARLSRRSPRRNFSTLIVAQFISSHD
ncbi:MAG TPA: hypothetical protein VJO34_15275 [Methylomirabilota bacterium]|nr:hypothetical protein [Methylomirabilota bacterium]